MKKIDYDKYLLPKDYNSALPPYFFMYDGKEMDDEEILMYKLDEILEKRGQLSFNQVLEMGIGTGRMTNYLLKKADKFHGIDISKHMVEEVKARYGLETVKNVDIETYIYDAELTDFDLICSFWAFNYAILDHYEELDMETKIVTPKGNIAKADQESVEMLKTLFDKVNSKTDFLFFYFDPNSVEQNIVTEYWNEICPFPYGKRDHTLNLLIETLADFQETGLVDYSVEKLDGYVYFPDDQKMEEGFVNLHFKGFFNEEESYQRLKKELHGKTVLFKRKDGSYKIPAGLYIIQVRRK